MDKKVRFFSHWMLRNEGKSGKVCVTDTFACGAWFDWVFVRLGAIKNGRDEPAMVRDFCHNRDGYKSVGY